MTNKSDVGLDDQIVSSVDQNIKGDWPTLLFNPAMGYPLEQDSSNLVNS